MSNLQMWSLLVAFFLPHVIAVVQQPRWNNTVRVGVTMVVCVVAGGVTSWLNGDIGDWHDVVGSILTVLVASVAFYNSMWKKVGAPQKIEAATSLKAAASTG